MIEASTALQLKHIETDLMQGENKGEKLGGLIILPSKITLQSAVAYGSETDITRMLHCR